MTADFHELDSPLHLEQGPGSQCHNLERITILVLIITHLFYMDNLKTYAKSDEDQKGLLKIVKGFNDIRMEVGLDKCTKATFKRGKRGKLRKTENIELDVGTTIQDLEQEGTYKYLAANEGDGIFYFLTKTSEQHKGILLVVVSFSFISDAFSL